ncbi:MAG: 1,4-alpha-glucan branching protein [Chryseobacterium sp.]|uniref:alpha-amylase family glycosyl hydrolase n=1 Tax=Chryseobacterium sp. TaxID=1871047 RepID=UPI000DB49A87|nr:alpha-amylase family glycosyl hydrolase [Chryseobacterium sp.]MPS65566.1 1,4-alpha-glucan branching protein [Chryseobacterium sp.]PZU18570.1 MAG: 1,4-alpha-glucan branching protein [Chryseobacterium sp.]
MKKWILSALTGIGMASCTTQNINKNTMDFPKEWKHTTNIYEVNVRQYTEEGTFRAFEKEMPRLKAMGVKTLWFMPITPIAQQNKKGSLGSPYAASDYVSINPEFGTMADFKHMVNAAHRLGFKVIIDWVANHTGWDHIWTKTHPEFYLKDPDGKFHIASGMDDIIELDYKNQEMRKAMIDAMKFWVKETNIDGFRCDLASWVEVDFWEQARPEVETIKPLFWLGEFDELENPEYGKVFDASYSWKWMHASNDYYNQNQPLQNLKDLLAKYTAIGDGSMRAWFTSNHDENSWNGTEYEKYGVITKPMAVFSATWNGVPLLYSGQELPNNKRLEFFEKDPIKWTNNYQNADFYKTLLNLKSSNPALRGGDPAASTQLLNTTANDKILAYLRKNGENEVLVVLNMSKEAVDFTIEDDRLSGVFTNVFEGTKRDFNQGKNFHFQTSDYAVFEK